MDEAGGLTLNTPDMNPPPSWLGGLLAKVGVAMQAGGPLVGLIGAVVGMRNSFDSLGAAPAGDSPQLSNSISQVLYATAAGLIIMVMGQVLMVIAITALSNTASRFRII